MTGKGRHSPFGPLGASPRLVMAGSVLVMGAVGVVSAVSLGALPLASHTAPPVASGPASGIGPQPVGPQQIPAPPAAAPATPGPAAPAPAPGLHAPGPSGALSGRSDQDPTPGRSGGSGASAPAGGSGGASVPARSTASNRARADKRVGRFAGNGDRPAGPAGEGRAANAARTSGDGGSDDAGSDEGSDGGSDDESREDRDARRIAHACRMAADAFAGPWDADDCVEYVGRHRAAH